MPHGQQAREQAGALLLITWLAAMAAVTWLVVDPLKDRLLEAFLAGRRQPSPAEAISVVLAGLDAPKLVLLLAALLLGLGLVAAELRHQAISAVLRRQASGLLFVYGALVLWLGHSYIGHGYLISGDMVAHTTLIANRVHALLAGAFPYWSNFDYGGLPLRAFYSPTTLWPVVWLSVLTGDIAWAIKAFLFTAHALCGVTLFLLGRQLGLSRLGATFAGLAYCGSFAHLHLLIYRGALTQALNVALLPLVFLFLHRVLTGPGRSLAWSWAGLTAASTALAVNYAPFAIVAAAHLAVFAIWIMVRAGIRIRRIALLAGAGAMAAGLAAFVFVPAALIHSDVQPLADTGLLRLEATTLAYAAQLLTWTPWRTNYPGAHAYLGLVPATLALVALVWGSAARLTGRPGAPVPMLLLAVLLVLSLVLRGNHVRDIVFTLLFTALLAGCGAEMLLARFGERRFVPALLLGALLVDLGSTAVQPVARTDKGWQEAAGRYLADQAVPTRTIILDVADGKLANTSEVTIPSWQAFERLNGVGVELASPAWIYHDLAERQVVGDLNALGHLLPQTRDLLCLLRVGRIVGIGPIAMGLPDFVDGEVEGPLGKVVSTHCPYQLVFAPTVTTAGFAGLDPRLVYPPDAIIQRQPQFRALTRRLLDEMAIDQLTGNARTILVQDTVPPVPPQPAAPGPSPAIALEGYTVAPDRILVAFTAASDGFVRLSQAWSPELTVTRNGQPADIRRDIIGDIVVSVSAGHNTIEIKAHPAPWQIVGDRISLAALLIFLAIMAAAAWRRRRALTATPDPVR